MNKIKKIHIDEDISGIAIPYCGVIVIVETASGTTSTLVERASIFCSMARGRNISFPELYSIVGRSGDNTMYPLSGNYGTLYHEVAEGGYLEDSEYDKYVEFIREKH